MLPASIYSVIYLILVTLLTFSAYAGVKNNGTTIIGKNLSNRSLAFVLTTFLILFIGLRPISGIYFGDTANYAAFYYARLHNTSFVFETDTANLLFDNLLAWFGSRGLGITSFFIFISSIYFGITYYAISRIFPNHSLGAFIVFLGAFSTFSYGTNGIKAGAAAAICLLAISYKENKIIFIILLLVSWGFHHSMSLVLAAIFVATVFKKTKWYFYLWVFCFFIAATHITFFQHLFANYSDETGASYLKADSDTAYLTGFRLDFILYSAMPILIGYIIMVKKKIRNTTYELWLRTYLMTNSIWMLCMYASYTNRIAYLSWFMYPIVLIYPFLEMKWSYKQSLYLKRVAYAHLFFTLLMEIIYY